MTAFKATLLSVSRASIPRNGVSSLSKLFTTSHPESQSKDSLMAEENRARLHEFLHGKCKSGKIDLHEAFYFFDYMIHMQPTPLMSSFGILLTALVISLHARMNSVGLVPNFITLNILINCFCKMSRVSDAFVVFGALLMRGFNPNDVTFTCLINGLCLESIIMEATRLLKKMIAFDCTPDVVTFAILIHGLCRSDMSK
ncbi:hypothetical protein Dsin_032389 [Dipteronia sinensis]|uniref:Pentatricopeptide repeat-containing protein n=1 Tax=Dipteronia sinensis TaxID=43782 RepID=A0AAE0DT50_9ROSI|nr:hypothetical protein Dsin_032389 [Dipteronia sinensis]